MATIRAREFNQDVSAAKRAAEKEPVIITDRGRPAYVLLSISEYSRLRGRDSNIGERLRMSEEDYFDYDFHREGGVAREVEW